MNARLIRASRIQLQKGLLEMFCVILNKTGFSKENYLCFMTKVKYTKVKTIEVRGYFFLKQVPVVYFFTS